MFPMTSVLPVGEHNGILIYDAAKLKRKSKSEHWFTGDPRDALMMVFTL